MDSRWVFELRHQEFEDKLPIGRGNWFMNIRMLPN